MTNLIPPQLRDRVCPRPSLDHIPAGIELSRPIVDLPEIPTRVLDREIRSPISQSWVIWLRTLRVCDGGHVRVAHQRLPKVVEAVVDVDLILTVVGVVELVRPVDDVADCV